MSRLLDEMLKPLSAYYADIELEELRMVQPEQVILVYRGGEIKKLEDKALTWKRIVYICKALANTMKLKFHVENEPNLSTTTPEGHRFECLCGPSVGKKISLLVRVKHAKEITLYDMGLCDAAIAYIQAALDRQANFIISGGSFTGKTTLLNNLLGRLPEDRRVISKEDTPELETERFWQGVALFAAREESQGTGQRTYSQLYNHSMRASPDNIVFGEISLQNAKAALSALNTGARGFFCTVHAEGPELVAQRFDDNINTAGEHSGDVQEYMTRLVDIVIQIRFDENTGQRFISELYEMKTKRYVMKGGIFFGFEQEEEGNNQTLVS